MSRLRQNIEKAKKNQMRRAARKKSMKGELEVYEGDETGVSGLWFRIASVGIDTHGRNENAERVV
jgi:ATP:corrinoid adenosyltransferase